MKHFGQVIQNIEPVNVSLVEILDVIRVSREHGAGIHLHAELSILLAYLHPHALIKVEDVFGINAL